MKHFKILKNFPYIFENNRTVVPPIKEMAINEEVVLSSLNDLLDDSNISLRDGFSFAYQTLLEMIKDHDFKGLGQI